MNNRCGKKIMDLCIERICYSGCLVLLFLLCLTIKTIFNIIDVVIEMIVNNVIGFNITNPTDTGVKMFDKAISFSIIINSSLFY